MSDTDQTKLEPWHLRFGRAKFLRPYLLVLIGCVYAAIYLMVAVLLFIRDWFACLPWISKPEVTPGPSPLVKAFHCANFWLAIMVIAVLVVYIAGPQRQIRALMPKKNEREPKT